jgi:hypothetical protein
MAQQKEIPEEIEKEVRNWKTQALSLRVLFIVLVLGSIIGALVVSTYTEELSTKHPLLLKTCGFVAAFCTSILAGLDVAGKANKLRRAVRLFVAASTRFKTQDEYTIEDLTKAYETAEDLIGDVNFIPQTTSPKSPEA